MRHVEHVQRERHGRSLRVDLHAVDKHLDVGAGTRKFDRCVSQRPFRAAVTIAVGIVDRADVRDAIAVGLVNSGIAIDLDAGDAGNAFNSGAAGRQNGGDGRRVSCECNRAEGQDHDDGQEHCEHFFHDRKPPFFFIFYARL